VTINEYLKEQGLTDEEVAAVVANPRQAAAFNAALRTHEEGVAAKAAAEAEKAETETYWNSKTKDLETAATRLTAAEKRAAESAAEGARVKAYMKSLADQGYDVPRDMYEGASAVTPVVEVKPFTRDEAATMLRSTAPDLVSLISLSNEYQDLFGAPYIAADTDFAEAQKAGKPLREYTRAKYNFDGKRAEKAAKDDQERIDKLVAERMKAKEAELAAKYGSNPETRTPMPSKFDTLTKSPGFNGDSWKSVEGRKANREARVKKFENIPLQ
jgi:hypothetical protein